MSESLVLIARSVWTAIPGEQAFSPGAVLVEGSKIVKVGFPEQVLAHVKNSKYRKIVLNDLYLFPGLINAHVHLTMNASANPFLDYISNDDFVLLLRALHNAQQMLLSGVTTVRDAGSRGYGIIALKKHEIQNFFALPLILVSGPPITPTGGHLYWMGGEVDGVREIRAAVRERIKKGVDVIKIVATGGKMTPGTRPEAVSYSFRELRSAVDEAHRLGVRVTAHCLNAQGIRMAVQAKVDCIDHAAFFVRESRGYLIRKFDAEVAKLLADAGVYVIPCLSAGYHRLDRIRSDPKTAEDLFQLEQEKLLFEHFAAMAQRGVRMVVGTDAGVTLTPFEETFLELILMVQAGLQPEEALRAATYYAAQALGLDGRKGVIQAGADADIVGTLSDPCSDITAIKNIVWIMREGRIILDQREIKGGEDICP